MDQAALTARLAGLPLGGVRYFEQIDSTNTEAARWIESGAPDLALAVADEQTAGKGRGSRRWFTPPGAALAFSLILHPGDLPVEALARLTALGALAVCNALEQVYGLPAQIKWPNDVLVQRRKLAGILVEAQWQAGSLLGVILGIGINVAPASVPDPSAVIYPATCVEAHLPPSAGPVDRFALLSAVLEKLLDWRSRVAGLEFLSAWESRLAFRGEMVGVVSARAAPGRQPERTGVVLGLAPDGALRLRDSGGGEFYLQAGELHLRPLAE